MLASGMDQNQASSIGSTVCYHHRANRFRTFFIFIKIVVFGLDNVLFDKDNLFGEDDFFLVANMFLFGRKIFGWSQVSLCYML